MTLLGPYDYTLMIDRPHYHVHPRFAPPATSKKTWKLYTIWKNKKLQYVGITRTRMSQRLNIGLKADGKRGYHGYKLEPGEYALDVWIAEDVPSDDKEALRELESVESEVAFLWRYSTGQWPVAQNEVHFHESDDVHRKLAALIVRRLSP